MPLVLNVESKSPSLANETEAPINKEKNVVPRNVWEPILMFVILH